MNSRQLQYAVLLSETGNFSQLAEKLNITQPALSKQILTLEKELGIQLFDRNNTPITLTAAGEYFIREAKELLYKEEQLLRSMEQFKAGDKGQLVIGITPFRSSYLISEIIKKVRAKFPGVQVKLVEESSEQLRKDAVDGKFDFAVVNLPVDDSQLEVKLIEPDRLVLVLSEELVQEFQEFKNVKKVDFKECKDIPFAVVGNGQEMRVLYEKLCSSSGIYPNIAAEVVSLTTSWEMACSGVAATLLPLQFVNSVNTNQNLTIVELTNSVYLRQPAIVYKRGQYVSEYAKYAIDLLQNKSF